MPTYTYDFPKADHTVDAVVFGLDLEASDLKVLLIRRGRPLEPFYGCWAVPGGFVEMGEGLDEAVRRELEEETGLRLSFMEQLYTFGRPDRDPRGRVISTAYLALVRPTAVEGKDDATTAEWHSVFNLPSLAFDHDEVIAAGLDRLRSKVRWQPVGIDLLPVEFTLSDLQRVYETVLNRPLDKRNFRRRVLAHGVLAESGRVKRDGHRPARLYRFDKAKYEALVKSGLAWEV